MCLLPNKSTLEVYIYDFQLFMLLIIDISGLFKSGAFHGKIGIFILQANNILLFYLKN